MRRLCIGAVTLAMALARVGLAADPYKLTAGPYAVITLTEDWKDAKRPGGAVTVPVKIYYPKSIAPEKDAFPLIVFSHGLGGSREFYTTWAQHWASHGYIVVLPTHEGSDTVAVLEALRTPETAKIKTMNAQTAVRRVQDVSFIITHMEDANAGTTGATTLANFKGKVDVKHVGMSGHSFGAQTTLMISGANEVQLGAISTSDKRITAAIAMSPQPTLAGDQKKAFASIKIPVLHLTGTLDESAVNSDTVKAADRRIPFDSETFPDTSLVIFKNATHMTFSARAANPSAEELNIHALIKQSTTAFWDAHLKDDAKAKAWLADDFAKVMGTAGTVERKKP